MESDKDREANENRGSWTPPTAFRDRRRRRRVKPDAEVVLVCNPRAGGRWKELAGILDSDEARYARRIVTDSVEDIAPALANLGRDAKLLCIYGGDGTVQRVLDRLSADKHHSVQLALLGGGTMNVTSRWCGFTASPGHNFRHVVRAFRSDELLVKEVPVLEIEAEGRITRGFTFGMGPIISLLDAYEQGRKGKVAAVEVAAKSIAAAWLKFPSRYVELIDTLGADVWLDDERLPYEQFAAVFANVTGQINPGVEPFVDARTRDSFYCAAYAVTSRELALALPMLVRGWLPKDLPALLRPVRFLRQWAEQRSLPTDPRYVNQTATSVRVVPRSQDALYTVNGEILRANGELHVELGPVLRLAVGPRAPLTQTLLNAAGVITS